MKHMLLEAWKMQSFNMYKEHLPRCWIQFRVKSTSNITSWGGFWLWASRPDPPVCEVPFIDVSKLLGKITSSCCFWRPNGWIFFDSLSPAVEIAMCDGHQPTSQGWHQRKIAARTGVRSWEAWSNQNHWGIQLGEFRNPTTSNRKTWFLRVFFWGGELSGWFTSIGSHWRVSEFIGGILQ